MTRTPPSWKTAATAGARLAALLSNALGWSGGAAAQQPAARGGEADGLDVQKLRDTEYLIAGAGSNIVAQVGPIGVVLVDSGSTEAAPRVLAALRRITPLPVRYIINTSMDRDHVGGNQVLTASGLSILPGAVVAGAGLDDALVSNAGKASVLAHENVQTRMSEATGADAYPFPLWPTKTFAFHAYSMYLNGEGLRIIHQPAAHTDGDVIVELRRNDVIVTGDVIDTTRFPMIDVARGGSVQGLIDSLNRLMDMTIYNLPIQWNDDRTLLVPGHGRVYDKLDLLEYRDAITVVRDRVADLIKDGKNLQQVKAANPTLGYRSEYGTDRGEWTTDTFVETIFNELSAAKTGSKAPAPRAAAGGN
jgi:glyoxylase-like metal-dependent hydrolase (beta-lactamase superfamily II)